MIQNLKNIQLMKSISFIICLLFITNLLHAQPLGDGDPDDVPIDGGLSLLVAAGIGYGSKRLRQVKKGTLKK
jgi:hypothetical protein